MRTSRTTINNPGSFRQIPVSSIYLWFKKVLILVFRFRVAMAFNFFLAEGLNIFRAKLGGESKFYCPVCDSKINFFLHHASDLRVSWNAVCPNCNSRSRHRGLWHLYRSILNETSAQLKILHLAPEPIFYPLFQSKWQFSYITADYILEDVDFKEDIQKLSFEDASYDLILCNHVIEHVSNDDAAFFEINRVLKPGGKAILTIPGDYTRSHTVYFNHLRFNGHYRDYGMDVVDKMKKYFHSVTCKDLSAFNSKTQNYGIKANELAFICTK